MIPKKIWGDSLEIEYFREFVELASIGSYTLAARKLNISQSVLSKHIKSMENELGVWLFVRNKRVLKLSDSGLAILPYAKQIASIYDDHIMSVNALNSQSNILRVGSVPSVRELHISELIAEFAKEKQNAQIQIFEGESADLIDMLYQKKCDIAFARGEDLRYSEMVKVPFVSDYIVAFVADSHPLANKKEISLSDLKNENLLFPQANTYTYDELYDACLKEGFEPHITVTSSYGEATTSLVRQGYGINLAHRKVRGETPDLEGMRMLEIVPHICSTIYFYYLPVNITPLVENFVDFLIENNSYYAIE